MQVKFWGTRGSIPSPGPSTVRYGGNTSCVELRSSAGTLIILDCGTGLRDLGKALMAMGQNPMKGHILITHTHWDHIQGLPFFEPLFIPGNEWDIYAPRGFEHSLRETLAGQMQYTYFPITPDKFGSNIRYHELIEGDFKINDIHIKTQYLNHPALTLGYRMEADGVAVIYATDHEPPSQAAAVLGQIGEEDRYHIRFLKDADLVIHDAQYIAAEYETKKGWGHSTVEYVQEVCRRADVKKVALTHHEPLRTDDEIDRIVEKMRNTLKAEGSTMEVFAAAEGQVLDLVAQSIKKNPVQPVDEPSALAPVQSAIINKPVLLGISDSETASILLEAVQANGIRAVLKKDNESIQRAALDAAPSIIILEKNLTEMGNANVYNKIRSQEESDGADLPIIIVTNREEDVGSLEGVSDWLVKPFSPLYARTRLHAWLLRKASHWVRGAMPKDEEERMEFLRELKILDTDPEERFDRITRLAAALFDVPMATVTLLDRDRQWFKSCLGIEVHETSREVSFCAHAVANRSALIVSDTLLDSRFADNPLVTGEPHIRFYAGQPLILPNGICIGTICVIDIRPRQLSESDINLLKDLGQMVIREILVPSPC